jgi:hypothetical protein
MVSPTRLLLVRVETMPLRDHFGPPLDDSWSWDELHGARPTVIVMTLNRTLPPRYVAAPRVHLGPHAEIDVTAYESDTTDSAASRDAYEVRVYDTQRHRRLVAAVEIVSPSNKDRPEHRRGFVAKCAALLQQQVSVAIVDLVTTRRFNLYVDLLELLGEADPSLTPEPPAVYAAACLCACEADAWRLRAWTHTLAIGEPLPSLPLWLADDLAVPLELEATYEETCRILRIG